VTSGAEAVVVGSGPNGLAAALTLAHRGVAVRVLEGASTVGGGCRTEELTLPGYRHDVCAAVHPLMGASPFFARLELGRHGVRLLQPEVPFAHPLGGERAALVLKELGPDGPVDRGLFGQLLRHAEELVSYVLSPMRRLPPPSLALARFGTAGIGSAVRLARRFKGEEARALVAGASAHSMLPLSRPPSAAFGLLLTLLAHYVGWPHVEGGSARVVEAMVAELEIAGGQVESGRPVGSLAELDDADARAILLDVAPGGLAALAGSRLPVSYRRALERFRHAPGVCKVDWALAGPVPWAAEACRRAGTVHVGGTFEEVAYSEAEVAAGRHPGSPFVIIAQPSVVDQTRAPQGHATLWGYCHVPQGSGVDMTQAIERQIERFAPGFGDLVLDRRVRTAEQVELHNPNCVGGDITGGAQTLRQTFLRPVARWNPYRTPIEGVYLCSASTPPGAGVHGMCGANAAGVALRERFAGEDG
jgi:phytoene dehydrogenase-like protein